jgi:hypothetical protein
MVTAWTKDELEKIAAAQELQIVSLRPDGTLSSPVTIWVVRSGDDLYVRSYKGRGGAWFRTAQARHQGRIRAGGVEKEVKFVNESDPMINEQIDSAYRAKYGHYNAEYIDPMVGAEARATTFKLVPC